ncbi:MAG TPA: hypothetical protein VGG33_27295 [Polyangia bacterium]
MRTISLLSLSLLTFVGTLVALPATGWAHDRGHGRHHHGRSEHRHHHGRHVQRHHHPAPVVAVAPAVTRVWVPGHWVGFGRHRVFVAGTWTVVAAPAAPVAPPHQPQWVWNHQTQQWVWQ